MLDPPPPARKWNQDFPGLHYPHRGEVSGCLLALNMRSGRFITELGARPPGSVIGEMVGDPERHSSGLSAEPTGPY